MRWEPQAGGMTQLKQTSQPSIWSEIISKNLGNWKPACRFSRPKSLSDKESAQDNQTVFRAVEKSIQIISITMRIVNIGWGGTFICLPFTAVNHLDFVSKSRMNECSVDHDTFASWRIADWVQCHCLKSTHLAVQWNISTAYCVWADLLECN